MTQTSPKLWPDPTSIVAGMAPENPVICFSPPALRRAARQFLDGFPGLVTYAVKANPSERIINVLVDEGITGFDVASPAEIDLIGRLVPEAARHYHNPIRSRAEIALAAQAGVTSYSVDSLSELEKLLPAIPQESEISARFTLPVVGAAYDFGSKFGASPEVTVQLLRRICEAGFTPSLTFHPGTQCVDPQPWVTYIQTAQEICSQAEMRPHRLNVGGGFPSYRVPGIVPDLPAIFDAIGETAKAAFGDNPPPLVCEPGRAICADAFSLLARVKSVRDGLHVFLNDGVYGGLSELPVVGNLMRIDVLDARGRPRGGPVRPRVIFGPTCDSVDRLPGEIDLPEDISEGDYLLFHGAGAYSMATNTRFNGFGDLEVMEVERLDPPSVQDRHT